MNGSTRKHLGINAIVAIVAAACSIGGTTFAFWRHTDSRIRDNEEAGRVNALRTDANRVLIDAATSEIRRVGHEASAAITDAVRDCRDGHEPIWREINEEKKRSADEFKSLNQAVGEIKGELRSVNRKLDGSG